MFGTLRIASNRLEDEARIRYRAAFCGGCHALRTEVGRLHSLLTNYDQTVLVLVLAGLRGSEPVSARCTALPLRTLPVQPLTADERALVAAGNVLAITAKLRDDVEDDGRRVARIGLRLLGRAERRSRARLASIGFPIEIFDDLPAAQRAVETALRPTLERLAEPTADALAELFATAGRLADVREAGLREFARALAEWIYVFDAWQDRAEDRRRSRFNAIDAVFGAAAARSEVHSFLLDRLALCHATLRRIPLRCNGDVLAALLDTLGTRTVAATGVHDVRDARRREAGECDLACCSEGCCEGGCLEGGSGPAADAMCCDGCCAPVECCCWTDRAKQRKRDRKERRSRRAGESTDEPETGSGA